MILDRLLAVGLLRQNGLGRKKAVFMRWVRLGSFWGLEDDWTRFLGSPATNRGVVGSFGRNPHPNPLLRTPARSSERLVGLGSP